MLFVPDQMPPSVQNVLKDTTLIQPTLVNRVEMDAVDVILVQTVTNVILVSSDTKILLATLNV